MSFEVLFKDEAKLPIYSTDCNEYPALFKQLAWWGDFCCCFKKKKKSSKILSGLDMFWKTLSQQLCIGLIWQYSSCHNKSRAGSNTAPLYSDWKWFKGKDYLLVRLGWAAGLEKWLFTCFWYVTPKDEWALNHFFSLETQMCFDTQLCFSLLALFAVPLGFRSHVV